MFLVVHYEFILTSFLLLFFSDGDPSNYLSYYRRATVYLALGRSRPGLQDLDDVIRLKPDFTAARAQRAGVLVKLGGLEEAHIDLEHVVSAVVETDFSCLLILHTIKTKHLYRSHYNPYDQYVYSLFRGLIVYSGMGSYLELMDLQLT